VPNYLDPFVRSRILQETNSQENIDRKKVSAAQYDIFQDMILPYVKSYLKGFLSAETVNEMPLIASVNLARRIVTKEAAIYIRPPKRTFVNASPELQQKLEWLYEQMKMNTYFLKANQWFKYQGQTWMQIILKNGMLKPRVLMKHQIDVVPKEDDPETADAYLIKGFDRSRYMSSLYDTTKQGNNDTLGDLASRSDYTNQSIADKEDYKAKTKSVAWWTQDFNFITDERGAISSGLEIENTIGKLPFIEISSPKDYEYYIRDGAALSDFTIQFNASLSDVMNIMRMQGFGQAIIKGDPDMIPENVQLGPNFIIKLPVNPDRQVQTDFEFKNSGADLEGSIRVLESLLSAFLSSRGLDPNTVNTKGEFKSFNSGLDRLLAMIEMFEPAKSDFDVFQEAEHDAFEVIKAYVNTYGGSELLNKIDIGAIPEDVYLDVSFPEPQMIMSEREKLDLLQSKLDMGIISKVEAISEARGIDIESAKIIAEEMDGKAQG
jgi:hypothetical protein